MKNTFLLLPILFASIVAVAQKKNKLKAVAKPVTITPGDPVLLSFNQKFSESTSTSWSKSAGGNFIASFEKEGYKQTAEFTPEGKWIRTKTYYSFEQLPEAVQKSIKEKYPDAEIAGAQKLLLENVPAFYKVSLKKDKDGWIVWVNETGIVRE
jgi:Putative beta-lactamase-inhibitor-like, PepSY-like